MSVEEEVKDRFNVQNCARQWGSGEAKTLGSHTTNAEMISVRLEVSGAVRANALYGGKWGGGEGLGTSASLSVGLTEFSYCGQTDNIISNSVVCECTVRIQIDRTPKRDLLLVCGE